MTGGVIHLLIPSHGTITLFAALNYLDGKILSRTETRHTHVEWLRFLKQFDRETPAELQLHLIVDNYATHKHEKVRNWLKRHPRIVLHFTPTASSWMNLVERLFAYLTQDCVREGSLLRCGNSSTRSPNFWPRETSSRSVMYGAPRGKTSCAKSKKLGSP